MPPPVPTSAATGPLGATSGADPAAGDLDRAAESLALAALEPPEPVLPPELRLKIQGLRAELLGERREVAVLFADLCGYTTMSEKLDPEEIGVLVNRLLQELSGAVYRYEGYVDKFIGDAIMALFGAPFAHEDDADRSVLAALDMLDIMRRHNATADLPLGLRIGINLGEVVAAHVGSGDRIQYTVIGDTVNVASRLEGRAQPNTILVSDTVARRLSPRFESRQLEAISLRGRAEPIQTYAVTGFRAHRAAAQEPATPFVGREAELDALERFLARTAGGQAGVLVLEAEPGTGKTRLVREALGRMTAPALVLESAFTAVRLPGQRPALADLFQQVVPEEPAGRSAAERALVLLGEEADTHRDGVEGLAREADPSAHEAGPPAVEASDARLDRWSALLALVRRAAETRPVVLVLEDLHWIDEATQEFLDFLVPRLERRAIGLLLTTRTQPAGSWTPAGAERISLHPLGTAAAERLLSALSDERDAPSRRELIARSGGNPLFLRELARAMAEARAAGKPLSSLPTSLQGLLVSRIDRLAAPAKLLLQMASVLGTRFPTRLLGRMYRLESQATEFESGLRLLEEGGFLEVEMNGDVRHRFHHALLQEAAYGGLLVRIRKVLHESAARLGEDYYVDRVEAEAAFFAHHFWEAGLPAAAAPHLWSAGRQAAERYELAAAERFLGRAEIALRDDPAVLPDAPARAAFRETFGDVLRLRGRLDVAETQFTELEGLGSAEGHVEWAARGREHRGRIAWQRGRLDEARELFESALAELPPGQDRIAADLHNDLGIVFYYRGEPDVALEHHRQALELREALGDRLGLAKSLSNMGNLLFDLRDDLEGARDHYGRALSYARSIGDRLMTFSAVKNLGGVALETGDWEAALSLFGQAAGLQEEMGWSFGGWVTLQNRIACEVALGRIDESLANLEACLREGDTILEPVNRVRTRLLLFDALFRALRDDSAEAALREGAELASSLGTEVKEDELDVRRGRLFAARGEWEAAAEAFGRAAVAAARLHHPAIELLALAHLRRAEARLGRPPAGPLPTAGAPRRPLRALLAYLAADSHGDPPVAARGLAEAGSLAAELGELALARAAFEREAEIRASLGDTAGEARALDRARSALRALGERLPADARTGFVDHPRNRRLADLPAA